MFSFSFHALGNTDESKIKMKYCLLLLCLFAAHIACSSVAQKIVINNFVKSLDEIDLIDPQWQSILEKVATKTDAKSTCLFFKDSKCLIPLRREVQRQKRKSNLKIRPFFLDMAKNFTKKRFPKISQVITDIFSNDTSVGSDTSSQIEASSNLLILSTMEKLGDFANMLKRYQPSLIAICATILSIVLLLLISCLAVVIDKAVQMAKARHQQELEDYFQLRQRAIQG